MSIKNFIQVDRISEAGLEYSDFNVEGRDEGRGYVVVGYCTVPTEFFGRHVKVCATLIKTYKDGRQVPVGFSRAYDAYQFALYLNGTDAGTIV